ncbi:hypothetical protein [Micromonospora wenchangensis]|uniref:hypothetical protein n=1 Tax=Micromonospora wenchangensis TaxID=1185415 RepID=UPI003D746B04
MAIEKHLEMIQAVISRMSTQSMTIKGWCITVTAALLGFGTDASPVIPALACYVVVAFAFLDAYYLSLERAHRELYQRAVEGTVEPWSFVISRPGLRGMLRSMRSPSIVTLYGASLLAATTVVVYRAAV